MGAPGNDKAISAIMKWVNRESWRADFDDLADQHLAPVCEEWDLEPDDLATELGEDAFTQVFGCILEDFLTSHLEPDGRNVVDDYLKRRGWKEAKPVKRYLEALRDSTMSLYEVIETIPGQGFLARDLLRESEPVQVEDKLASAHLVQWDRIAARLLPIGNKIYMSGGTLPISFLDAGAIGETIAELSKEMKRNFKRLAKRGDAVDLVNEIPIDEALLHNTAPLFIRAWVESLLSESEPDMPTMANMDGEDLMPTEVRFPIAEAAEVDEIAARLDAMDELTRDRPDHQVWTWLGSKPDDDQPKGRSKKKRSGRREDEPLWVYGGVRLSDTVLMLDTNSMERATRGRAMLAEHLGDLVGQPLTATQSLEQALEEAAPDFLPAQAELPISPAQSDDLIRQTLEKYYRHILKSPVAMLDGKTPKQAVRSKSGRRMTAEWLKYLENQSAHQAANDTMPAYDFSWMWEELKITELRG